MNNVVVGGGLAAQRAIETLCQGAAKDVVMVSEESRLPYDRPPLSKGPMGGAAGIPASPPYLKEKDWYEAHGVDLRLGVRAVGLDASGQTVNLSDGSRLPYSQLLCATGSVPRRMAVEGGDLAGVFYLRTWNDAENMWKKLSRARRVAIVGGGFIGAEVAAVCIEAGLEVVLIDTADLPFSVVLGKEVAQRITELHLDKGVTLRLSSSVSEIIGRSEVAGIRLNGGEEMLCDAVVIGVGVDPADDWVKGSGVRLDGGIVVDEYCRTSLTNVYAAGDVARWPCTYAGGSHVRLGHWDNAEKQGAVAAKNMLGVSTTHDAIPYFWSDQYGVRIQHTGYATQWERFIWRGDLADCDGIGFYVDSSRLLAAVALNRPRDMIAARRLIAGDAPLDIEKLADDSCSLKSLRN